MIKVNNYPKFIEKPKIFVAELRSVDWGPGETNRGGV